MDSIRDIQPSDYFELVSWWTRWDIRPPSPDQLPPTGLIIPGSCALFLYETKSSIAFVEWLVSNPDNKHSTHLDVLIQAIMKKAKQLGYTSLYSVSNRDKIAHRGKSLGWKPIPGQLTAMFKEL